MPFPRLSDVFSVSVQPARLLSRPQFGTATRLTPCFAVPARLTYSWLQITVRCPLVLSAQHVASPPKPHCSQYRRQPAPSRRPSPLQKFFCKSLAGSLLLQAPPRPHQQHQLPRTQVPPSTTTRCAVKLERVKTTSSAPCSCIGRPRLQTSPQQSSSAAPLS